ncbi:hypothetical protein M514_19021 [Trichuris suis]|uniref:Uncharacterized protein n=1 Tax=Trichuris suis TaxID=68888 RepID=A0A085NH34_9BILA|nr:hypothetical protein M514_19021 [Trichuris suis]
MRRHGSLEKSLMPGEVGRKRKRDHQKLRWIDSVMGAMNMGLTRVREIVEDRKVCRYVCSGRGKGQPASLCSYH